MQVVKLSFTPLLLLPCHCQRSVLCWCRRFNKQTCLLWTSFFSLLHSSRPWTASSLWWTWRVTSCLCLKTWPSTCATTRRSSWTPASTACCTSGIMPSSSRTCCPNPSVSHMFIFHASICFALRLFFTCQFVSRCVTCVPPLSHSLSLYPHVASLLFTPRPHLSLVCFLPSSPLSSDSCLCLFFRVVGLIKMQKCYGEDVGNLNITTCYASYTGLTLRL